MIYRIQTYLKNDSGNWQWADVWCYKDGEFDVGDTQWTEASNSIGSLTFDVYPTNHCYEWLKVNKRIRILNAEGWTDTGDYYGFKCVFAGRVIEVTPQMDDDGLIHKEVVCEDALGFLQDSVAWFDSEKSWFDGGSDKYDVDIDDDGVRTIGAEDYIKLIVAQHNQTVSNNDLYGDEEKKWKKIYVGDVDLQDYGDDDDDRKTTEQLEVDIDAVYDKTSYELLCDVCDELNAQFSITYDDDESVNAYLNVSRKLGETYTEDSGRLFQVADNIAESALETSIASTATRVFPWGDEYAKLKKNKGKSGAWLSGTNVKGRLKGSDWKKTSSACMTRFNVEGGLKVHVIIGKRDKDYASVFFTSKAITTANDEKDGVVLNKYSTKSKGTGVNLEKWYPVPEDAKFCYVYGAKSTGTKLALYSEYTRKIDGDERTIKDKYKVGLGFWLDYLKNKDKKAALKDFGVKLGSVTDKSDDKLYYLGANENKYGIIEAAVDIDRCHLKTEKITDSSSKITSVKECVTVGKKKTKKWRQKRARLFFREACRQASALVNKSLTITAKAYDLRAGRYEEYPELHLYDEWRLLNDKCGIDHTAQIMRIQRDLREPWEVTIEFGDQASRYTSSGGNNKNGSVANGNAGSDSGQDGDDAADTYATLMGEAAEAAAEIAIEKADELDSESYKITVDAQAAGQLATEAYDKVAPITAAMRGLLDDAEEQANTLTSVIDRQEQTISLSNELAQATATYACETEKSVVRWRQTYTADLDAWASDDEAVQKEIAEAYQLLYGGTVKSYEATDGDGNAVTKWHCVDADGNETGPANVQADSAQGRLNSAKAEKVTATQTKAEMEAAKTQAESYLAACKSGEESAQAAYKKAKAAYEAAKKKAKKKSAKRLVDTTWTAFKAAESALASATAKVEAAQTRCDEAGANFDAACKELEAAEQKVTAAEAEVDTAMNGIHEKYSSTIEQTAKSITSTVSKADRLETKYTELKQTCDGISTTVASKIDASEAKSICTQTIKGWTWSISDIDGLSSYMSFTNTAGTGTLTLGGQASQVVVGQSSGSNITISSDGSVYIYTDTNERAVIDAAGILGELTDCSFSIGTMSNTLGYVVCGLNLNGPTLYTSGTVLQGWYGTPGYESSTRLDFYNQGRVRAYSEDYGIELTNGSSDTRKGWHGLYSNYCGKWIIYATASGAVTCAGSSSKWVKENIADMTEEDGRKLLDIRTVRFDYKAASDDETAGNKGWRGVIAEETYGIIPGAVVQSGEEPYEDLAGMIERGEDTSGLGVDYGTFIPYLIKLCQMQQAQIDDLTARVAALEGGATASGDTAAE